MDVAGYLRVKEKNASPLMAAKWCTLGELHSKRLWHQLTVVLLALAKEPELQENKMLVELYMNFIKEFEHRLNKQSYMELCALIVTQFENPVEAHEFLDNCEKLVKTDLVALALCKVTRGQIKFNKEHDSESVKSLLEEVDEIFNQIDGISTVHGRFYLLQSQFHLSQDNLTGYYRSAIKFLGCTPLGTLPLEKQKEHAKNLAVSSLVADGMYNFGELLAHPILDSLKRTHDEWLLYLVKSFNVGDVEDFGKMRKAWSSNKMLAANEQNLREKVILLAIMEITFERSATERQLTFKDIAHVTKLDMNEVEKYVMKAFSKGLVIGKIDSVGQKVYMNWVQPRVLEAKQIDTMNKRIADWQTVVGKAEDMMKRNTVEILED